MHRYMGLGRQLVILNVDMTRLCLQVYEHAFALVAVAVIDHEI